MLFVWYFLNAFDNEGNPLGVVAYSGVATAVNATTKIAGNISCETLGQVLHNIQYGEEWESGKYRPKSNSNSDIIDGTIHIPGPWVS